MVMAAMAIMGAAMSERNASIVGECSAVASVCVWLVIDKRGG